MKCQNELLDEDQVLRDKMLERLPTLALEGVCPVPNSRFWDYYNLGGKESLRAAGIVLKKTDACWVLFLQPELPSVTRQRELETFFADFSEFCECGTEIVLERKVCRNGVKQYRLRCADWYEKREVIRGYG